jgi:hypothetical protein
MKKVLSLLCFLVMFAAPTALGKFTTSQLWLFDEEDRNPVADVVDNPYGDPALQVVPGTGGWADGVWALSGEIDVIIPNRPVVDGYKEITITLRWSAGENLDAFLPDMPLVGVTAIGRDPTGAPIQVLEKMTMDVVHDPGIDWTVSVYDITIWPNPVEEWIAIKGDILVDSLKIETDCIPEPATMGLLGLGSLALLRIRRKR